MRRGQIDLGKSIYRTPNFHLAFLCLVGGATFGIGMVLASGCGSKDADPDWQPAI
jgi:uncharacterized membrane protein YedE/YeeE